jgi:kynurenine formamidase
LTVIEFGASSSDPKLIDLSQPLARNGGPHPSYRSQILRQDLHADYPSGTRSWATEQLICSTHAGTHVDSFSHYDAEPGVPDIAAMGLEPFYGPALCVDVTMYPPEHYITDSQLAAAVERSGQPLLTGDVMLLNSDHNRRHGGRPQWRTEYAGVSPEAIHWMADRGVKIFGVETPTPDLPHLRRDYPAHQACAERRLTHYENLDNLARVVNTRFIFCGFPLSLEFGAASPVRAVAITQAGA